MRVVALISGGKDSCYNMMQCVSEGHEIIALANLRPKDKDEIDSYMFQTVGHQAIDLYAEAMGLPLFRQTIEGTSVEQGMYYKETEADEVEDLFKLLSDVKEECQVDAVSVGAILSDYQRVRVENVCQRLGLTALAYLWRREQDELLDEMIAARVNAIIVKVAAMGLNPDDHLGLTLDEIRPHMHAMNEKYGLNICGEGGEYETFTLDCPLFEKKIIIDDKEIVMHSDDAFAPVAYLQLKDLHLEPKEDVNPCMYSRVQELPMLRSSDLLGQIFPEEDELNIHDPPTVDDVERPIGKKLKNPQVFKSVSSTGMLYLAGFTAVYKDDEGDSHITQQTKKAMKAMKGAVEIAGFSMSDIAFVHLCVRDMNLFALVNSVYRTFFGTNPPIRVCIETCLPSNVGLMLSCGVRQCSDRKTMHVQGLSHWAPANIGPYSQAVKLDEVIYVAGQIPLIPGCMQVVSEGILPQARLSLCHADRVLQAIVPASNGASSVILAVCYVTHKDFVSVAEAEWKALIVSKDESFGQVEYVVITSLPRNCLIEWEVYAALTLPELNTKHAIQTQRSDGFLVACRYSKLCLQEEDEDTPAKEILSFVANVVTNSLPEIYDEKDEVRPVMRTFIMCIREVLLKVGFGSKAGLRLFRIFYRADIFPSLDYIIAAYNAEWKELIGWDEACAASFMPVVGFRSQKCIMSICM